MNPAAASPHRHVPRLAVIGTVVVAAMLLSACSTTPSPGSRHQSVAGAGTTPTVGDRAAFAALEQIGVPYRYGGENPTGFDCSGLVQYAYLRAGKALPRTTSQLWHYTDTVEPAHMRAGDLLFFEVDGKMQHVGMYVGEGRFVHAPSSGKTVTLASLDSGFYSQAFLRAGRP